MVKLIKKGGLTVTDTDLSILAILIDSHPKQNLESTRPLVRHPTQHARRQQLTDRHSERSCEFIQVVQAEVAFCSFYAADVGSMQSCLFGQGFLGPAEPRCIRKRRRRRAKRWRVVWPVLAEVRDQGFRPLAQRRAGPGLSFYGQSEKAGAKR